MGDKKGRGRLDLSDNQKNVWLNVNIADSANYVDNYVVKYVVKVKHTDGQNKNENRIFLILNFNRKLILRFNSS